MADLADMINGDVYNLKMLSKAIRESGFEDTLRESGPFTVFAPVDEAFAKLPQSTVDGLFDDKTKLKAILSYHVVPDKLSIADIRNLKTESLTTLQGQLATVDPSRWHLHVNPKINGVNITDRKDVVADNGILHEIDGVMMPNFDLTCPICGKGFLNKDDLDAHTSTAHQAPKVVEPTPAPAPAPAPAVVAPVEPVATPVEEVVAPVAAVGVGTAAVAETVAKRRTRQAAYEMHKDKAQKYRFHLKAPNGEIIGESQGFSTPELADQNIESVKNNAPLAQTVCAVDLTTGERREPENVAGPVFDQFKDTAGKWRFNLKDSNGKIILASQAYQSIESCNHGIEAVKNNASTAKTVYSYKKAGTSRRRKAGKAEEEMMIH